MNIQKDKNITANVIDYEVKAVEAGKLKEGSKYLLISFADGDILPDFAKESDIKKKALFDLPEATFVKLTANKAAGAPFLVPTVDIQRHRVSELPSFCNLHQEASNPTETKKIFAKGDPVLLPNGDVKWRNDMEFFTFNDDRFGINESPEAVLRDLLADSERIRVQGEVSTAAPEA